MDYAAALGTSHTPLPGVPGGNMRPDASKLRRHLEQKEQQPGHEATHMQQEEQQQAMKTQTSEAVDHNSQAMKTHTCNRKDNSKP